MADRHPDSRFPLFASTLVVLVLMIVASHLRATAASAEPLESVTGPVNEATAPIQEAAEEIVPPATPPPPTAEPPAVQTPEVELPAPPPPVQAPETVVKTPAPPPTETGTKTVEGVTKTVEGATKTVDGTTKTTVEGATKTVEGATKTAEGATKTASGTAGAEARGATEKTIGTAAATAETAMRTPRTAFGAGPQSASTGSTANDSNAATPPMPSGGTGATTAPRNLSTMVFPRFPARILRPFIYVWPAVALLAEGPLGSFVARWSHAVQVLLEENGIDGSGGIASLLGGAAQPLAKSPAAASSADQPPFSWLTSPGLAPFNWVGDENALVVLALFLVLGASALGFLVLGRRELGLPMFRRGNRFPWRH